MRVGVYLRVSTKDQTEENQRLEIGRAIAQRGWLVAAEYVDHGISGAKGRDRRPEFDALWRDAMAGKFDVVAAWSVDRAARSLAHLATMVVDVRAAGVELLFVKQGIDTTTPTGRAMVGMAAVFAELEREIMRERINAGVARARVRGTRSGKPIGRPPVSHDTVRRIRRLRAKGMGMVAIGRELRCGSGTVRRVLTAA